MRKAGDILRVFLDRHTADQAELYTRFFSGWQKVVGERIAAHSEVKDIRNGTVIVEVDHPGWIQMIQMKQARIVEVLKREYPDLGIRGLRLQLPWRPAHRLSGGAADRPAPSEGAATAQSGSSAASGEGGEEAEPAEEPRRPAEPERKAEPPREQRPEGAEEEAELPPDPRIRSALSRLGRVIEEREQSD